MSSIPQKRAKRLMTDKYCCQIENTGHRDTKRLVDLSQSYICPTCLEQSVYTSSWQCTTLVPAAEGQKLHRLYSHDLTLCILVDIYEDIVEYCVQVRITI